jgi:hypothetical protein
MYPVRLGHDVAIARIERLLKNKHYPEALVTSVFTLEKVLRRTLKELVVSAGFTSKAANQLMKRFDGFERIKEGWWCFDPAGETLPAIIGNQNWEIIPPSVAMRNKLVHGERAYPLDECAFQARKMLEALHHIESTFQKRYGYSGWTSNSIRRLGKLHVDPRVKTTSRGHKSTAYCTGNSRKHASIGRHCDSG